MRKLVNVPKPQQKELAKQFDTLINLLNDENYSSFHLSIISVFNKTLNNLEASQFLENGSSEEHKNFDQQLHQFILSICKEYSYFVVKLKGKHKKRRIVFKQFTSEVVAANYLKPKYFMESNHSRFILVFPELDIVYFENWDFTHLIYYRDKASLDKIKPIAENYNLFFL